VDADEHAVFGLWLAWFDAHDVDFGKAQALLPDVLNITGAMKRVETFGGDIVAFEDQIAMVGIDVFGEVFELWATHGTAGRECQA